MTRYETTELGITDLSTGIVYRVDDLTAPIIRKKGLDMLLRPVFEITFIGRKENVEEKSKGR